MKDDPPVKVTPPKLTPEDIDALVQSVAYHREHTLTVAVVYLSNGAQVVGTSNVLHPLNFNEDKGRAYALEDAKSKLWELEGYAIKTRGT
jgi:hypothetical protein